MSHPLTRLGVSLAVRKKALPKRGGDRPNPLKEITQRNQQRLFEEIVMIDGPAAKDLQEVTGLAQSTVAGIVKLFVAKKLVTQEKPSRGTRGRQPSVLRVNGEGNYIVGVEIRPDRVQGLVTNLRGEPRTDLRKVPLPSTPRRNPVNPDAVVDAVRVLVDELKNDLVAEYPDQEAQALLGLGVELGGHIDGRSGTVVFSPNLRWGGEWTDPIPLRQRLRDATRLHTVVDNDVNALAVAQRWFAEGRKTESYAVVYIAEEGIGGGLLLQGELVRGARGRVAEIGHTVVAQRPVPCRCGGKGCLEAVVGPAYIERELRMSFEEAQQRARDGDEQIVARFKEAGQAMGHALVNLFAVTDPGTVIFTGSSQVITTSVKDGHSNVVINDIVHEAMYEVVAGHPMVADAVDSIVAVRDEDNQNGWNGPRGAATLVIRDVVARTVQGQNGSN
ncbi:hypothetical protein GCM10022254_68220 [Actinomadura meridiana]|uniref:Uncharacterized protein n=1 Tax=Actinomadura meridiana TaxID=559626 RepID=A0ABP8CM94_9ACTN